MNLAPITHTQRGLELIVFKDAQGRTCHLQQSCLGMRFEGSIVDPHIYLGADPNVMMLSRHQVYALAAHLQAWLETMSFQTKHT